MADPVPVVRDTRSTVVSYGVAIEFEHRGVEGERRNGEDGRCDRHESGNNGRVAAATRRRCVVMQCTSSWTLPARRRIDFRRDARPPRHAGLRYRPGALDQVFPGITSCPGSKGRVHLTHEAACECTVWCELSCSEWQARA